MSNEYVLADTLAAQHGSAWGDEIDEIRKQELWERLSTWWAEKDHGDRKGPFADVRLAGAEVFWLAVHTLIHSEQAKNVGIASGMLRHRRTLKLNALDLGYANLFGAHLERATLPGVRLSHAYLEFAQLKGAYLVGADLEGVDLGGANLDGAWLHEATLTYAILVGVNFENALLRKVDLRRSVLWYASFNAKSDMTDVQFADPPYQLSNWRHPNWRRIFRKRYGAALADVHWNGADLTRVKWSELQRFGEEDPTAKGPEGKKKTRKEKRPDCEIAARAYRQMSSCLRQQGLAEEADRFAYRAQICQRKVYYLRMSFLHWLFSWVLFMLAGYGYRPLRTFLWYLAVISGFALAYYQATHGILTFGLPPTKVEALRWYEAVVLSISSFHGRGFFQPVNDLGDPVAILASLEAVFGLFIEISFIATFTQRFFGSR